MELLRWSGLHRLAILPYVRYTGPSPHNPHATEKGQSMRPLERLTWEAILDLLSTTFRPIPDAQRPARVDSTLHDTLLSGLAMMFFQHPSLLAL